ncbi:hypothetical protein ACNOYE_22750 [Nannocystaceae bacterium ST9]
MRSLALLGIITLAACVAPLVEIAEAPVDPTPPPTPTPIHAARSDACVPLDGDPAHCCPSRLGLDPELARDRCGFAEYLGERSESACVHVFRDRDDREVELRVTPIVGLTDAGALALHRSSFVEGELALDVWTAGEAGEITWTSHADRSWAFVPGWPQPRRVSWQTSECGQPAMLELLRSMAAAPIDPAAAIALPIFTIDLDAPVELAGLLIDRPAARPDADRLRLPDDAPAFAQALIDRAADDDLAGWLDLLGPGARWGLPDRRQIGGRPIGASPDAARPSFVALRRAAARLSGEPKCPAPDRRLRMAVWRGEHPQWCFWVSDDGLDVLALGLRSVEGHARLEYLGLFPERPHALLESVGEPPAPPLHPSPTDSINCGDPHHDDPIRCPAAIEPEPAPDQPNQRPASTMR